MIRTILTLIFVVSLSGVASGFTLVVTNVRAQKGHVAVAVFNRKADFFKKPYASDAVAAESTTVRIHFDLPDGEYAAAIFQDLNDNHKLDRGWFSIPTEPYGFSNDVSPKFSAPTFEACKFTTTKNTVVTITLQ